MKWDWKREIPALAVLFAMFATAAMAWPGAADRLPVHWDISGHPNRWGGRFEGLFGLPLTALGLYVLMVLLPRIDPRRVHYASFSEAYSIIRTALVGALLGIQLFKITRLGIGAPASPRTMPIILGTITIVVGNYLPKLQSNWFVGVRTPWTLSSEESWRRTHRLAGWLLVVAGLGCLAAAAVRPGTALRTFLVLLAITVVSSVVYSYLVWRHDPASTPPADLADRHET